MQINQRWGRLAMVSAIVAALSACAAYPQGGYQSGGYQGGYSQGAYSGTGYPGSTQAYPVGNNQVQTYPANNCGYNNPNCYSQQPQQYAQQGRVMNIETVRVQDGSGIGAGGAIAGGVIGGVLGNQVGKGTGRAAATAVGVLGGAVAGNAIEGRNNQEYVQGYRLSVQLDQGGYRVYDVSSPGDLRIGDRVRLYNGQISRM